MVKALLAIPQGLELVAYDYNSHGKFGLTIYSSEGLDGLVALLDFLSWF